MFEKPILNFYLSILKYIFFSAYWFTFKIEINNLRKFLVFKKKYSSNNYLTITDEANF